MRGILSLIALLAITPVLCTQDPNFLATRPPKTSVSTSNSRTGSPSRSTSSQKAFTTSGDSNTHTSITKKTSSISILTFSTKSKSKSSSTSHKRHISPTSISSSKTSSSLSATSSSSPAISSSSSATSSSSSAIPSSSSITSSISSSTSTPHHITRPPITTVTKTTYTVSKHSTHDSDVAGGFFILGGDEGGVLAFPGLFKGLTFDIPDGELDDVEPGPDGKPSTSHESTLTSDVTTSTTSSIPCSVTTAFDYWVECLSTTTSGQPLTCTTTSTSTTIGCSPTATAVTTIVGEACVLPFDNDDEGEEGDCPDRLACNDPSCSGTAVTSAIGTTTPSTLGGTCQFVFRGCNCTFSSTTISSTSTSTSALPCFTADVNFGNPGFEGEPLDPWNYACGLSGCYYGEGTSLKLDTEKPHSGTYALGISNSESGDQQYEIGFYLYQEIYACVPGTYSFSFWGVVNNLADCPDPCCTLQADLNDQGVYEGPGDYQLAVGPSYSQFTISLGQFNSPTTLKIGVSSFNCYVANLYLDDFALSIS